MESSESVMFFYSLPPIGIYTGQLEHMYCFTGCVFAVIKHCVQCIEPHYCVVSMKFPNTASATLIIFEGKMAALVIKHKPSALAGTGFSQQSVNHLLFYSVFHLNLQVCICFYCPFNLQFNKSDKSHLQSKKDFYI